jgi:hypothetical protein
MDERERRKKVRDGDTRKEGGKLRKKHSKRGDAPLDSTSQAVFDGVGNKRSSKKINYDALQGVFSGDGSFKLPTPVVVDPSLNVFRAGKGKNVKPTVDKAATYPFAPLAASSTSSMRLSLQGHDKPVKAPIPRKTSFSSQAATLATSKVEKEKPPVTDDIPLRAGVKGAAEVPEEPHAADEDMLMYDEGGDNDYDDDDDEEY